MESLGFMHGIRYTERTLSCGDEPQVRRKFEEREMKIRVCGNSFFFEATQLTLLELVCYTNATILYDWTLCKEMKK